MNTDKLWKQTRNYEKVLIETLFKLHSPLLKIKVIVI